MSEHLHELLQAVRDGSVSVEQAELELKKAPFEDLGYAKIDFHRSLRQGAAEVIYGAGKTPAQIAGIVAAMHEKGVEPILITRLSPDAAAGPAARLSRGCKARHHRQAPEAGRRRDGRDRGRRDVGLSRCGGSGADRGGARQPRTAAL